MNAVEPGLQRQSAVLIVPGMGSDHCAGLVSQSLKRLPGIAELSTSIASHKVRIEFDAEQTSLAALKQAVEQAGYQVAKAVLASTAGEPTGAEEEEQYLRDAWRRMWVAGVPTTLIMLLMALPMAGVPVPGYYNLPDRAQRLDTLLNTPNMKWTSVETRKLMLDVNNNYGPRILRNLLPAMNAVVTDPNEKAFMEPLTNWDGTYDEGSIAATLFTQMMYELAKAAFADELGPVQFANLLETRALDFALPLLVADNNSPWWDDVSTPAKESHFETTRIAWSNTLKHLQGLYGTSLLDWRWGVAHTLTHGHPLGRQKPLDKIFNVGPFQVPCGRETPNNLSGSLGPAPWAVTSGPSTRPPSASRSTRRRAPRPFSTCCGSWAPRGASWPVASAVTIIWSLRSFGAYTRIR